MVKKSDTFKVPDEWSFNNPEVIEHFDRHVKESLPWYDLATGAVVSIGGAIIVVDKMVPHSGYAGTVNYRLTLAAKYEAGATPEEIIKKELSISGLQRPLSAAELSGFVEFFRFGDFVGAVWEKPA